MERTPKHILSEKLHVQHTCTHTCTRAYMHMNLPREPSFSPKIFYLDITTYIYMPKYIVHIHIFKMLPFAYKKGEDLPSCVCLSLFEKLQSWVHLLLGLLVREKETIKEKGV